MENLKTNEKKPKRAIIKKILLVFFIIFLTASSFFYGIYLASRSEIVRKKFSEEFVYLGKVKSLYVNPNPEKIGSEVDFNLFWEVWDDLKKSYVDKEKLNDKKMFYGAIKGMVESIGDPYTVFMDPKIAQDFSDDLAGTFEGIGAEIGLKNDIITIIAPLPDMPAEKAGLKAGDKIIAIDSEPTMGLSVDEAVLKIRGPKNTQVVLSIFRDGFDVPKDFTITRSTIVVKSVRAEFLKESGIFEIKISNFNNDTEKLFNEAVSQAVKADLKGIILDLRNNPGGYLDTAIEIASEWVSGEVIVTEKYSDEKKIEHLARGRPRLKGVKTVVLVNQGSASASEIVAGALKDYQAAVVIGMKTFGKGSVQSLLNLKDGSSVKITVAKWLTPSGHSINDDGILPDFEVNLTQEDFNAGRDPQKEAAIAYLKGDDISGFLIKNKATTTTETKK